MSEHNPTDSTPGFDQPLALLRACHARMLDHCELLEQLIANLNSDTIDTETAAAARSVMAYFSSSALEHHLDEEGDLFPLLARQSLKLADLVHSLRQEHAELDALWKALEVDLRRFPEVADRAAFSTTANRFCELSRQHVRRENMEFLPRAESSLSSEQLKDIGAAMAERRGVRYTD
ncbi:MAG: hemerythrin domain-containing protein [Gammaproteobacteria bacterium]|jgi:hemerythrin-like domain-containing protein